MNRIILTFSLLIFGLIGLNAQEHGWHHQAPSADGSVGISSTNIYSTLLKNRSSQTVVVAVIDSGVDVEHEDLKDNIWINQDEIPGNGIDDDKNGYIDDIHGWNFIGGADGANVNSETLEVTRLYRKYMAKYADADESKLSKKDKIEYAKYLKYKGEVEKNLESATKNFQRMIDTEEMISSAFKSLNKVFKNKEINAETIKAIDAGSDQNLLVGKNILIERAMKGEDVSNLKAIKKEVLEQVQGGKDYYSNQKNHYYNVDFDTRHLVGDNYNDSSERYYGNNDVEGPDALHGTHVAGIIGAVRDNELGMNGVAANVKLMSVRTVPDGDERDKDVANAIRYAVDNGASIINMSFGKGFSWDEAVVEEAIKHAIKHDVLLVHAAGNSSLNTDIEDNFPNDTYESKFLFFKKNKKADNWMEIGALSYNTGEMLAAPFSNYGADNVDLFAPGMAIYSTLPNDEYKPLQGTSMAAPVVAGVAAVLRSYFPTLTAVQVKNILMTSSVKLNDMVIVPGSKDEKLSFSKLSVSGGVVNAKAAIETAMKTKGKKKVKSGNNNKA